jgi:hypothetical protein
VTNKQRERENSCDGERRMLVASCRRGYPADIAARHGIIIVSILRAKLLWLGWWH